MEEGKDEIDPIFKEYMKETKDGKMKFYLELARYLSSEIEIPLETVKERIYELCRTEGLPAAKYKAVKEIMRTDEEGYSIIKKPIFRTLLEFLLGFGFGVSMDMGLLPSDGTLSNIFRNALLPALVYGAVRESNSVQERVKSGVAVYVGSVIGQTVHHFLKNL